MATLNANARLKAGVDAKTQPQAGLGCGECSRFIADLLLWKCVEMWISGAKLQHENKGGGFGPAPQIRAAN